MSFSRTFPKGHPQAGEPTLFIDSILSSFYDMHCLNNISVNVDWEALGRLGVPQYSKGDYHSKLHTCRAMFTASGKVACKAGDKYDFFSWEGTPYRSKQIVWARGVEIVRTVPIKIMNWGLIEIGNEIWHNERIAKPLIEALAANDGLTVPDYKAWMECTKSVGVPLAIRIWDDNGLGY